MKPLGLATGLLLFMFVGNAMAQIHNWPPTDTDPYFKKKDLEKHRNTDSEEYQNYLQAHDKNQDYIRYPRYLREDLYQYPLR